MLDSNQSTTVKVGYYLLLLFVPIAATLATATRATLFNCAERRSSVCGTAGLNAE
jgi:hypothetical protein